MCVNHYCPMCGHTYQSETEYNVEVDSTDICLDCEKEFHVMINDQSSYVITSLDKFWSFHNPIPF